MLPHCHSQGSTWHSLCPTFCPCGKEKPLLSASAQESCRLSRGISPLRSTLVCRAMAKAPRGKAVTDRSLWAALLSADAREPRESLGSGGQVQWNQAGFHVHVPTGDPSVVGVIRRKACLVECVMLNLKRETLSPIRECECVCVPAHLSVCPPVCVSCSTGLHLIALRQCPPSFFCRWNEILWPKQPERKKLALAVEVIVCCLG